MIPSDRKRRRLFLFFCVCVAFFSSSSFFCSSSSRASDDAFDFDDGVGGVYDVEEEEHQQKRRRILRTILNEDKTMMIPPKWARARNENDLETDRKYVLKNAMHDDGANNNGRGEENKTLTRRAKAYANFENAFAEGSSSWKVKTSKRMPAKTCAKGNGLRVKVRTRVRGGVRAGVLTSRGLVMIRTAPRTEEEEVKEEETNSWVSLSWCAWKTSARCCERSIVKRRTCTRT